MEITPLEAKNLRFQLATWMSKRADEDLLSAMRLTSEEITKVALQGFLAVQLGEGKTYSLFDDKYWTVDLAKWKEIISVDFINQKQYIGDKFDCDNFAFYFSARMAYVYGLTCGLAVRGDRFYLDGTFEVGHLLNAIVTKATDGFHLYWYEPQTDELVEHQRGQEKIKIGNRLFKPTWIIGF